MWVHAILIEAERAHVKGCISEILEKRSTLSHLPDIAVGLDVLLDILGEQDPHIASFAFKHEFAHKLVEAANGSSERSQC